MVQREQECKACAGDGMLADDEGWQYECSVCHGKGFVEGATSTKLMDVDHNNRLLD